MSLGLLRRIYLLILFVIANGAFTYSHAKGPYELGNSGNNKITDGLVATGIPEIIGAIKNSDIKITVTFSEPVQTNGTNPDDFKVTDCIGNSFAVIAQADGTSGDNEIVLTVTHMGNAAGDITLTYANNNNEISSLTGTPSPSNSTGVLIIRTFDFSIANQAGDDQKLTINSQVSSPLDVTFNPAGTKMFVTGSNGFGTDKEVYSYTLGSPFDLSSATYDGDIEILNLSQFSNVGNINFNNDGTKLFVTSHPHGSVNEYVLSTAYKVSTGVYQGSSERLPGVSSIDNSTKAFTFNNDGTKVFIIGSTTKKVLTFDLSTPFDVSTGVYAGDNKRFDFTPHQEFATDIVFTDNGNSMILNETSYAYNYRLSIPYDVSSATYLGDEERFRDPGVSAYNIRFTPDGSHFFVLTPLEGVWKYNVDDKTAPVFSRASTNSSKSRIDIRLTEAVRVVGDFPADFQVTDGAGTSYPVTSVYQSTANSILFSIAVNSFSQAVGDLKVTYANNNDQIVDLNCNPYPADATGQVIDIDTTVPEMTGARKNNNTEITLTFSELVQTLAGNPTDFTVKDEANTIYVVSSQVDGTEKDNEIVLTVSDLSGAVGDLTITYNNDHNEISDFGSNQLATDATGVVIDISGPVFTSATTAGFEENANGAVYTATATDNSTFTYSLGTGNDEALFNIDGASGVVTFKNSPDFESPEDSNTDNAYIIQVIATDALSNASNHTVTITVTNIALAFTSVPVTSVIESVAYNYDITATDDENNTFTGTVLPGWLSLNEVQEGIVTTFVGSGSNGSADGSGTAASFSFPAGIVKDGSGNFYVADITKIRKITPAGVVSTFFNSVSHWFLGLAIDGSGNIIATAGAEGPSRIIKITPGGVESVLAGSGASGLVDGIGTAASFRSPSDLVIDASGDIFVVDTDNHVIRKVTAAGEVTTFAGTGSSGNADGTGTAASFNKPSAIVLDASGNFYITDRGSHRVRKMTPAGVVTTIAGSGTAGSADGTGTAATFNFPTGITIDGSGNLYVMDAGSDLLRKITPGGVVTTLAGSGSQGFVNGTGSAASFNASSPHIEIDASGNLFITDGQNYSVRKVVVPASGYKLTGNPQGQVGVHNVTLTADDGNGGMVTQIFTVTVTGKPAVIASAASSLTPSGATLNGEVTGDGGVAISERGFVYAKTAVDATPTLAAVDGTTIIKQVVAGTTGSFDQALTGLTNNTGYSYIAYATNTVGTTESSVQTLITTNTTPTVTSTPTTTIDEGDTYTYTITTNDADGDNVTVTAPTIPAWLSLMVRAADVTTLAGAENFGSTDANGIAASFRSPVGVALDASGNVYVADEGNHKIRKVAPNGDVTTFAGSGIGGSADGNGIAASFNNPSRVAVDASGNLYVADKNNHKIRKIAPNGDVTTIAGSGSVGSADGNGVAASFNNPSGVAVDASGNIYVADQGNHNIRKIATNGDVTTFAGSGTSGSADGNGAAASFNIPIGVAVDASGNVYVADFINRKIRKIAPNGDVTTFAGSGSRGSADGNGTAASFDNPKGVAVDASGNVYVAESGNRKIRKIASNGDVTTLAGSGSFGSDDGIATAASFNNPSGVAVDASGNVYVGDRDNYKIRKITTSSDLILTGNSSGQAGNHDVVLEANDGNGGTVQQVFTITVRAKPTVTLSVDNATVVENGGTSTITATLSNTFGKDVTVNLAYTGTATSGTDYNSDGSTSITITAGNLSATAAIGITATDDVKPEANEAIIIDITGVTNGTENGTQQQTITITNDDTPDLQFNSTTSSGAESTSTADITVDLSISSDLTVTVDYTVTGTATGGTDYTLANGTLTLDPGDVTKNISVASIVDDAILETNETVILTLSNPGNANLGTNTVHTYTITDNDVAAVTIADVSGAENGGAITVTATLDNAVQGGFTVDVSTADGTATTGDSDYTAVSGQTLTFAGTAGETQTFTITPTGDTKFEADETIAISQNNLAATTLAVTITDGATVTITNDDTAPTVTLSVDNSTIAEAAGTAAITATLSAISGKDVTVNLAYSGTATSGTDYNSDGSTSITITAGNLLATVVTVITATDDVNPEANETIIIDITGVTNGTENGSQQQTITITDDDIPTVQFQELISIISESVATANIPVVLSIASGLTVTVDYTVSGTATPGTDFTLVDGTLTFNPGSTIENITIANIVDDSILEAHETVVLTLSTPVNANLGTTSEFSYTIVNNDAAAVTIADVSGAENGGAITVTATLDNPVQGGFTVNMNSLNGTASTGDSDYAGIANKTLTFSGTAGESHTFTISPLGDTKLEADETLTIVQNALSGTTLKVDVTDEATVTITNDDTAAVTISDVSGVENGGDITITATLDNAVHGGFTVNVGTADGTALAAGDYTAISAQTLTFAGTEGEIHTFILTPANDAVEEAAETLTVSMSGLAATTLAVTITDNATITITDDDDNTAPTGYTVAFDDALISSLEKATSTFTFAGAEVGTTFNYTVSSSGGGTNVTGAGTIVTATDKVTLADLSGLGDGTLTLSVTLKDASENVGATATATTVHKATIAAPSLSPADNSVDILPSANLVMTFGENVNKGAGSIVIKRKSDDSVLEAIDVTSANVSISSAVVTINPTNLILPPATEFYVTADAGVFTDDLGNPYSGISNKTDWTFTIIAASTVSSVDIPSNDTYKIGDNLDFTVNMILPVSITGTATIPVTIGGTVVNATQVGSVTNSSTILFRYTVLEDQLDADGIAVGTAMNLDGGTMKDQFNVNAILTLNNIGVTTAVLVDGIKPTPTISSSAVSLVNGVFSTTITYDEIVENFVLSDLTVSNGSAGNLTAITAGKVWNVDITPTADGIVSINLTTNVANDVAGNESKASNTLSREFDGTAPIVVSINRKDGDPLITGTDNANFRIIFSEDVTGVDLTDFEIVLTGSATGTLNTIIAVDAKTYDMNVNGVGGQGTIGMNTKDDDTIKDAATNPLGATFTGQVYTTNFIPTDIGLSATSIDENNGLITAVATISTTDADAGNSHSYALVAGTGDTDNSSFIVDGASIKTNSVSFDFETNNSYSIRLKTDDGNGGVFEKAFTITVKDVNEVPLSLDLSNNSIDEDDNAQDVGALTALDPDAGDTFSFSLTSGTGDDHNGQFAINGTTLRTAGLINFEDGATRSILVRVTDSGGNTLDKQFTINIGEVEIEPIREFNTNSPGAEVKNVFSPNGDGVNETWVIEDILDNPINEVKVYAQGGKLIFSKTNYQNDWDATFKGDPIPDGTYYYEINIYNGQKIIKGFLTIIRNK